MHPKPYTLVALVIGLLLTLVTLVPVNTFGAAGSADVVVVEGVTKTFQVRDWDGQEVEVAPPFPVASRHTDKRWSARKHGPHHGTGR